MNKLILVILVVFSFSSCGVNNLYKFKSIRTDYNKKWKNDYVPDTVFMASMVLDTVEISGVKLNDLREFADTIDANLQKRGDTIRIVKKNTGNLTRKELKYERNWDLRTLEQIGRDNKARWGKEEKLIITDKEYGYGAPLLVFILSLGILSPVALILSIRGLRSRKLENRNMSIFLTVISSLFTAFILYGIITLIAWSIWASGW